MDAEMKRQIKRQREAAWLVTGAVLVAIIVLYVAIAASLAA